MVYRLRQAGSPTLSGASSTREHFVAALEEAWPDIILSDFNLPGFDGLEALAPRRSTCRNTPFYFVSEAMEVKGWPSHGEALGPRIISSKTA